MDIHDKINARSFINDFAAIGQSELKQRINRLGIRETGDFENMIRVVGKASADSLSVEITYLWYGIFSHYGVGKGVSMGDQGVARMVGGGRTAKKWMTGVGHMRSRLAELYAEEMADGMSSSLLDALKNVTYLKF